MEVPLGQEHPENTDNVDTLCVIAERFDVTLYCSGRNWEANSYIYVYGMLSNGESELMLKARYDDNQSNESFYYLRGYTVHAVDDWY